MKKSKIELPTRTDEKRSIEARKKYLGKPPFKTWKRK